MADDDAPGFALPPFPPKEKSGVDEGVPPNRFDEVDVLLPNNGPLDEANGAEAGALLATGPDPNENAVEDDCNVDAESIVLVAAAALELPSPLISPSGLASRSRLLIRAFSVIKNRSRALVGMARGAFAMFSINFVKPSANFATSELMTGSSSLDPGAGLFRLLEGFGCPNHGWGCEATKADGAEAEEMGLPTREKAGRGAGAASRVEPKPFNPPTKFTEPNKPPPGFPPDALTFRCGKK